MAGSSCFWIAALRMFVREGSPKAGRPDGLVEELPAVKLVAPQIPFKSNGPPANVSASAHHVQNLLPVKSPALAVSPAQIFIRFRAVGDFARGPVIVDFLPSPVSH